MKTIAATSAQKAILFFSEYVLLIACLFLLTGTGCDRNELKDEEHSGHSHDPARKTTIHYGQSAPLGGGVVRTFITTDKDGKPVSVGVALSKKALTGLPDHEHEGHDHQHSNEYILPFAKGGAGTPFTFVALQWNPKGHEPDKVYTLPHFDFHFYTISDEDRKAIPGLPADQLDPEPPAARYFHSDYLMIPGRVPAMGTHWVDKTSPELNGGSFTQTLLMGSYQHKVVFYEPMITLAYLLENPKATIPVKQPEAFAQRGYYPTNYRIEYDEQAKEYRVALADFTMQEAK